MNNSFDEVTVVVAELILNKYGLSIWCNVEAKDIDVVDKSKFKKIAFELIAKWMDEIE